MEKHDILSLFDQLAQHPGRVCVVGSANADLTVRVRQLPKPGETIAGSALAVRPGGKSANQAATVGRLGVDVELIGAVGRDPNGALLRSALVASGVSVDNLIDRDTATGTAMILVDDAAENCIVISPGANGEVDAELVINRRAAIESANTLGLCLEVSDDAVLAAARIAHQAQVKVIFNLSPIRTVPEELLNLVDILVVNEHELAALIDEVVVPAGPSDENWRGVSTALLDRFGIQSAVVTLGGAGSVVLEQSAGGCTTIPIAPFPTKVVDTTGCGDSYLGTLLAGVACALPLRDAAQLAAVVSAYAAASAGAQASYGTLAEIRDFAKAQLA